MGGGVGRVELRHLGAGGLEVEVEGRRVEGVDLRPGLRADRHERQARRQHQRLLRADAEDVDAPRVRPAFHRADARDPVHGEHGVRLRHGPADLLDGVAGAGRGLAQSSHHASRVGMLLQGAGDPLGIDRLTPLDVEHDGVDAERLANVPPALGEVAGVQDDGLAAPGHGVDSGGLHGAGAGGSEDQDVVLRLEDLLQGGGTLDDDLLGLGRAVVDDRPGQFEQDVFGDRGRPGSHQARLLHRENLGNRSGRAWARRKSLGSRRTPCGPIATSVRLRRRPGVGGRGKLSVYNADRSARREVRRWPGWSRRSDRGPVGRKRWRGRGDGLGFRR